MFRLLCMLLLLLALPELAEARYGMCPEEGCRSGWIGSLLFVAITIFVGGLRALGYLVMVQIGTGVALFGGAFVCAFIGKQLFGESGAAWGGAIGFALTVWGFLRWDRISTEKRFAEEKAERERNKVASEQPLKNTASAAAIPAAPAKQHSSPTDTYYANWVYVPREDGTIPNDDQIKLMLAYRARFGVYPEKAPGQSKEEFLAMLIAAIPYGQRPRERLSSSTTTALARLPKTPEPDSQPHSVLVATPSVDTPKPRFVTPDWKLAKEPLPVTRAANGDLSERRYVAPDWSLAEAPLPVTSKKEKPSTQTPCAAGVAATTALNRERGANPRGPLQATHNSLSMPANMAPGWETLNERDLESVANDVLECVPCVPAVVEISTYKADHGSQRAVVIFGANALNACGSLLEWLSSRPGDALPPEWRFIVKLFKENWGVEVDSSFASGLRTVAQVRQMSLIQRGASVVAVWDGDKCSPVSVVTRPCDSA